MKFIFKIVLFGICILFLACTEEGNLSEDTQTAIVEGYLFAGHPADSLVISQSFSYFNDNEEVPILENLGVEISDGTQTFTMEHSGSGVYQNPQLVPELGKTYTLTFEHNGALITAETYIPEKKTVYISQSSLELEKITDFGGLAGGGNPFGEQETIEITWDNEEGDYYYVVVNNLEENPECVNDLLAQLEDNGIPLPFSQITEPEISDFHALNSRRDLTQYGTYRIIVYRVNPEYAALYESAGTSSITIAEPPTNVENGLGIFTGVSSDTVYLEVTKK